MLLCLRESPGFWNRGESDGFLLLYACILKNMLQASSKRKERSRGKKEKRRGKERCRLLRGVFLRLSFFPRLKGMFGIRKILGNRKKRKAGKNERKKRKARKNPGKAVSSQAGGSYAGEDFPDVALECTYT